MSIRHVVQSCLFETSSPSNFRWASLQSIRRRWGYYELPTPPNLTYDASSADNHVRPRNFPWGFQGEVAKWKGEVRVLTSTPSRDKVGTDHMRGYHPYTLARVEHQLEDSNKSLGPMSSPMEASSSSRLGWLAKQHAIRAPSCLRKKFCHDIFYPV